MAGQGLRNGLRDLRLRAGLQQRELAEQAGVSRQALSALEQGDAVPATDLALRLAQVLGCRVDDLFWLEDQGAHLEAVLLGGVVPGRSATNGRRVALAALEPRAAAPRWLARVLDGEGGLGTPADGLIEGPAGRGAPASALTGVRTLRDPDRLRQNLFVAGCDPALALLGGHLADRFPGVRLHWVEAASGAALDLLGRSQVHLAGAHLYDEESGEHNVAAVRRRLGDRPAQLVNLAVWELGLVVLAGNPRRIRKVGDLARKGVRVMAREKGSGAEEVLTRRLADAGVPRKALSLVTVGRSHMAVARAVAAGSADAGVATRLAAADQGLDFIPLDEARFDLVVPADTNQGSPDARVDRLLDVLRGDRFRRDLGGLAGYGTARTGEVVARTEGPAS